jgi:hemolysin D
MATSMRRAIPVQNARGRHADELAFLPAALEIVETPPSPIGRAVGATIIALFCVALIWAWTGLSTLLRRRPEKSFRAAAPR